MKLRNDELRWTPVTENTVASEAMEQVIVYCAGALLSPSLELTTCAAR